MTSIDLAQVEVFGMQAGRLPFSKSLAVLLGIAARGVPIPPAERAIGCDTSHWDGTINFPIMQGAGARFVYFKASQGTSLPDSQYNASRASVGSIMPWGSFHFLTTENGAMQADYFCNIVGDNPGVLPPVLDVELQSVASSVIKAYCIEHCARLNRYPIIYTSAYFWDKVTGSDKTWISNHCLLFVAHWGTDAPVLPSGWTLYTLHQYSADGNGMGHTYGAQSDDMDLDRCRVSWLKQFMPDDWMHCMDAWARSQPNPYTGPEPE
jgi:hypothetical protein